MDGEPPAVYVVDDDASVLLSLKRLLSGFGFEVLSYLTAEGFLQDHETGRDGCVILDLLLPGMDGLRLQEKLAACGRPIIFLSGRSEEHTSELQSLMRISYAVFCLKKN